MAQDFQVKAKRGPGGLATFGDHLIPENFEAHVVPADPALPICYLDFTMHRGRPLVIKLRCEWRGFEGPINGEALRQLPIAKLTREAARQVALRAVADSDGGGVPVLVPADPPESLPLTEDQRATVEQEFQAAYAQQTRGPRRRGPLREEELRGIAQVYRAAVARDLPPTREVAQKYGVARSTAGRWVAEARRRGVLGPARPRQAGELDQPEEEQ